MTWPVADRTDVALEQHDQAIENFDRKVDQTDRARERSDILAAERLELVEMRAAGWRDPDGNPLLAVDDSLPSDSERSDHDERSASEALYGDRSGTVQAAPVRPPGYIACPLCRADGYVDGKPCDECGATGLAEASAVA